jgi:assimilatory nitrate reductase electron transfer subunit
VKIVVIGNGMAGFRVAEELVARAAGCEFTVVGEEPGGAYNRVQLPLVLSGAARADSIELADEGWYAARGVHLVTGSVSRIDRARRLVEITDGPVLPYDVLILATGSEPVLPPIPGAEQAVAFRTLRDLTRIQARAATAGHAVVLGGGVLGLETARGLACGGLPVTLVHRGRRLMERQLEAGAARVLARTARGLGVRVRTGAPITQVRGPRVVLEDGVALDADLLVVCCGTRPRTELARAAGLAVRSGVVVDEQMRSITDPRVFAIGDCAEHRGSTSGLVGPAWAHARVAAQVVAGEAGPGLMPSEMTPVIRLKASGIELAVLGRDGGGEVVRFTDPARGVYQKLVVRNGKLTSAILLGDTRAAGTLTQLADRGTVLPADRASLLSVRRESPAADTTICRCNGVTRADLRSAWQNGARDTAQVAAMTRATTGCGTCREAVEGVVAGLFSQV